jgi:tRNA threonylcarbamoyladenosine biosynthesis protein TsaB
MSNLSFEGVRAARINHSREARASGAPLTLCVDSATDKRSVAVAQGINVIAKTVEAQAEGRSSVLLSDIDSTLRAAGATLSEIELFAVANGPGSFTGLRAALATIKAFAVACNKLIAAVPTLHAVALTAGASAHTVAMVPAGRGEVFAQSLRVDDEGRICELDVPAHLPPSRLMQQYAQHDGAIRWTGSGARVHLEMIREYAATAQIGFLDEDSGARESEGGSRVWRVARPVDSYTTEIARLGLISHLEGETVRPQDLRALYVRDSDAELKEQCPR